MSLEELNEWFLGLSEEEKSLLPVFISEDA